MCRRLRPFHAFVSMEPILSIAMSFIGGPIETSMAQLAQAQQTAAEGRDRERAASESARRAGDSVKLRVAGLEHPAAVRGGENDDLEKGKRDRRKKQGSSKEEAGKDGDEQAAHQPVDVRA